ASPMRRLVRLAAFRCHCRTRVEPATTKESIAILSDFFVASPEQAERYDNRTGEPDGGSEIAALLQPTSYTGFTSLQIEMLWAILEGVAWNVKQHTLETISFLDEGTWLQRFPTELT